MEKDQKKYIQFLENKIEKLENQIDNKDKLDLNQILNYQKEFLISKYVEKDALISQNKHLIIENTKLLRTIELDRYYQDFLINSFWWKLTSPFRRLSHKLKAFSKKTDGSLQVLIDSVPNDQLKVHVTVIIFTYNAGNEFKTQLKNIINQKSIEKVDIVVVDRNSEDHTVEIAKEYGAKVINIKNKDLDDSEIYEMILPKIKGNYIAKLDQNVVVKSSYWLYKAIKPIINGYSAVTIFYKRNLEGLKKESIYSDLKNRIVKYANYSVLYMPKSRDVINYLDPLVLFDTSIVVKKKVSNMFLI